MQPFNGLEDGLRVVLVDSWPGGGRLTWEVEATKVLAEPYSSKRSAVRMIANAVGLTERESRSIRTRPTILHPATYLHSGSGLFGALGSLGL